MMIQVLKKTLPVLLMSIALNAIAQQPVSKFGTVNENSVVKDSTGKQLAFDDWQKLIKEGSYVLHPVDPYNEHSSYVIAKMTVAEMRIFKSVRSRPRFKFDSRTVVEDSTGKKYTYPEWSALTKNGNYVLKPVNPTDSNSKYLLAKLTDQEKQAKSVRWGPAPGPFKIGETFKKQTLTDIYGISIKPGDWAGKTVVLNFWFIDCAPCRQEIPELSYLADSYASNPNIIFIAIARDKTPEIKAFIKQTPFNYRLVSNGKAYADELKINGYPTNVVINKNGEIAFTNMGFAPGSNNALISAIAKSVNQ